VAEHFVLALETLATFGSRAAADGAVVRSIRAVHVGVRTTRETMVSSHSCSRQILQPSILT